MNQDKGMTFIMLECNKCGLSFSFNPLSICGLVEEINEMPLRTPISGSHGFVTIVETKDGTFYGCSETGLIWRHQESLFRDIGLIIKKYPYRESCYKMTKSGWIANSDEPSNIDELIDKEIIEDIDDFERD